MTVPKPETRTAYKTTPTSARRTTIYDYSAAAFLFARDHAVLHVGLDSNGKTVWFFGADVQDDLDLFFRAKDHLLALRALQDETGGFLTYIPLAYHPDHNELGETLGRTGTATTGFDDLKNIAVGRLLLDNIPHVKTHWPMVTPFISQVALTFGCDDLEGTVVFERVYHEAGAPTPMWLSYDEIVTLIRGAGKEPVERDSLYQTVRTFEGYEPTARAPVRPQGPAPQGALFQIAHRPQAAARAKQPVSTVVDGAE